MNGLVGAQNRGRGKPTEGKERKRMILKGSKQRAGRDNLRKREKTNGFLGLKTGGRAGQPKKKREKEWISRCLKQGVGHGGPTLGKKRK